MSELEVWLIGESTKITDIDFLARVIILVVIVNVFIAIGASVSKVGK